MPPDRKVKLYVAFAQHHCGFLLPLPPSSVPDLIRERDSAATVGSQRCEIIALLSTLLGGADWSGCGFRYNSISALGGERAQAREHVCRRVAAHLIH
jgi:hypothetical protein